MKTMFVIPGKPQGKARVRAAKVGTYIHTYTPAETVNYETYVKMCFKQADKTFFSCLPLQMRIRAYFPLNKSMPNKARLAALDGKIFPVKKPDADNIIKIICDALNCIAYSDDKVIVRISCEKLYAVEPRVEVEIEEIISDQLITD